MLGERNFHVLTESWAKPTQQFWITKECHKIGVFIRNELNTGNGEANCL